MQNKDIDKAPVNACHFNNLGQVEFAAENSGFDFSITGYSGKEIKNHWYWGNLAFDLQGLSFAKTNTPVFEEHELSSRIGFSKNQQIKDKVTFEGIFLENEKAVNLRNDMKKGFPMEASLSLRPSVIERVADGEQVEVNGYKLKGPGHVFRKAVIKEVSMCVFGADCNTSSRAFADGGECYQFSYFNNCGKENEMADKDNVNKPITAESFAADQPEIHEQIAAKFRTEGKNQAEKEFSDKIDMYVDQFGDDPAFCIEMLKGKVEFKDAVKKQAEKLKKEKQEFLSKTEKTAETNTADAAEVEFSDDKPARSRDELGKKGKTEFDESTATEEQLKAHFNEDESVRYEFSSADVYAASILGERGEL